MNSVPVLYHGTKRATAKKILAGGFRRSRRASYTGTATNLTECLSIAWEYGDPFNQGAILKVTLKPDTRWQDSQTAATKDGPNCESVDDLFKSGELDALKTYSGNVWLVWNPACVASIELIDPAEALRQLAEAIVSNGPELGYNADVASYAGIIWGEKPSQSDAWYHDYLRKCAVRLNKVFDLNSFWTVRAISPSFNYLTCANERRDLLPADRC